MLSALRLSCRKELPNLQDLTTLTRAFNQVCGRKYGHHAMVLSSGNTTGLLVCYQQQSSFCTKVPATETAKKKRKITMEEIKARMKPAHYADENDRTPRITEHMLMEARRNTGGVTMTFQQKVKDATMSTGYVGIIIIGFAALCAILYSLYEELFRSDSPNNIYSESFKIIKKDNAVKDALGEPIKCFGEETRRGWRRHVLHHEFNVNGEKFLRMKYYLKGQFRSATVTLEKRANARGRYDRYAFIVVELDGYPSRQIVVETDPDP